MILLDGSRTYVSQQSKASRREKEMNLETVTTMLQERTQIPGAMWAGRDIFSSIYQYMIRYMNRYRNNAFRVLLTLKTAAAMPEAEKQRMRDEFRRKIRGGLRGSDVMMECGESQVFLLLPGIREQDIDRVIGRLMKRWSETGYEEKALIDTEYAPVEMARSRTRYNG